MRFVIRLALLVLATGLPAFADTTPVRVFLPFGLGTSDISTTSAKDPDHKYVTIDSVRAQNPSRHGANSYEVKDFHLLVGDKQYLPVVRPGLAALDLGQAGIVGPGEETSVTVTFLVPAGTTIAKFEFTPHWLGDSGFTADWCCYYP
jgi:hypothetical protein